MRSAPVIEKSRNSAHASHFRPDIQGLRAVAVVAVILDHLTGWPPGGFVGVDVFFVISGFLITGLLLREYQDTGSIAFAGFYVRRIKRIMPAALLVLVVTSVASWALLSSARFTSIATDATWAALFSANWRFMSIGTDYFTAGEPVSPLQHYWSLSVEEQFYFVWPWLMLATLAIGARVMGRKRAPSVAAVGMAVIVASSFSWALYETATNATGAYFSTFSRTWELGVGALLAIAAPMLARIPDHLRPPLGLAGLATILGAVLVTPKAPGFPAPWAMLAVVGATLVIVAGARGPHRLMWPLTNPVSRWVGDLSYSLYLWHFPVIAFAGVFMPEGSKRYYALAMAAILVLSTASYYLWEDRIRKLKPSGRRLRLSIPVAAILATAALAVVAITVPQSPKPANTGPGGDLAAYADPSITTDGLRAEVSKALNASTWPTLSPSPDDVQAEEFPFRDANGCKNSIRTGITCANVVVANPSKTVVVIGDSTAAAYMPMIRAALEPDGWDVESLTMVGCYFLDAETANQNEKLTAACPEHMALAVDVIERIRPALIISTNLYGDSFVSNDGYDSPAEHRGAAQLGMFERLIDYTDAFVMLSPPPPGGDMAECKTAISSPADCIYEPPTHWGAMASVERAIADSHDGLYFVDAMPWFCDDGGKCPSFVDGIPIKRDRTHISAEYGVKISALFGDALKSDGLT